jgi:hypothetical protein
MIQVHFIEFELEQHGFEAPSSYQHCAISSSHFYWNYLWWGKHEWKAKVP